MAMETLRMPVVDNHTALHIHHAISPKIVGASHAAGIRASEVFDKEGLIAAHLDQLHDAQVKEMVLHPPRLEPPLAESPSLPLKGLKPILLKDMKLGKFHRSKVLHGTLCVKSVNVESVVSNVLEDETGLATKIVILHALPVNCSIAQAQRRFPAGSKVAIREPYLTELSDGMIGILVEKHADIVFLWVPDMSDEGEPSPPTPKGSPPKDPSKLVLNGSQTSGDNCLKKKSDEADVICSDKGVDQRKVLQEIDLALLEQNEPVDKAEHNIDAERKLKLNDGDEDFGVKSEALQSKDSVQQVEKNSDENQVLQSPSRGKDPVHAAEAKLKLNDGDEAFGAKNDALQTMDSVQQNEEKSDENQVLQSPSKGKDPVHAAEAENGATDFNGEKKSQELGVSHSTSEVMIQTHGNSELEHHTGSKGSVEADEKYDDMEEGLVVVGQKVGTIAERNQSEKKSLASASELRKYGNQLFAKNDLAAAVQTYGLAIAKAMEEEEEEAGKNWSQDEVVLNFSNRSEVFLMLHRYEEARADAAAALARQQGHSKSLFRMGRALLGLGFPEKALDFLLAVEKLHPLDRDLKDTLKQCRLSIQNSKHGDSKRKKTRDLL